MSILRVWGLFKLLIDKSTHYGILEPLFFNPLFNIQSSVGIVRIIDLLDLHNSQWKNVQTLADQVGLRSVRSMEGFVKSLKASFPSEVMSFVNSVVHNGEVPQNFPVLKVIPKKLEINESGQFSLLKGDEVLDFQSLGKMILYPYK